MTHATTADIAATDAAAAVAFDMLNAARRIEGRAFKATQGKLDDGPEHEAYKTAIRATDAAKEAYDAIRAAGAAIRAL